MSDQLEDVRSMAVAIHHIKSTIELSPKAYEMFRDECRGLAGMLALAELRHKGKTERGE